jgi:hypothetical protein
MATYCVILRAPRVSRAVRFYLQANSADHAYATAVKENPEMRALGIELPDKSMFVQNQPHAA